MFVLVGGASASTRLLCAPAQSHPTTHPHHTSREGFYRSQKANEGSFQCSDCAERQVPAGAVVLLVFVVIVAVVLLFLFKKHKKKFFKWTHDNRLALNALGDTVTVLWVTMQVGLHVCFVKTSTGTGRRRRHQHRSLHVSSFARTTYRQTLVLVVRNHKEAGGKDMPSNYERFLSFFSFVSIDLLG